jgi:hypothetical protein
VSPARSVLISGRGYALTLISGLAAAGAVAVGVTKPWLRATATVEGMPRLVAEVSGTDVSPAAGALGLATLAAFGAVVATRGWVRVAIGVAIVAAMVFVAVSALFPGSTAGLVEDGLAAKGWAGGAYNVQSVWWRWLVAAAAVVGAMCGALVVRFGRKWATMGERYDAPTERKQTEVVSEADAWRAIDRGDDPTTGG